MSSLPPPITFDPKIHSHLLPQLAQIHADCVLQDGTLATFLPLSDGKMHMPTLLSFWQTQVSQVEAGSREIFLQMSDSSSSSQREHGQEEEEEVMGYVSLYMPPTETGPFRSLAEKLMVSPRHRKRGVARAVMGLLEKVAKEKGRGLVMLDTTIGSGAEHVYPKLGYISQGIIPKYGIHPLTMKLVDEIFFYKDLRD